MGHRKRGWAIAGVVMVAAALAGCGGDGGDASTSSNGSGDLTGYCDAALAWNTPPDPENHEFDEEWFESVLRPRFEQLQASAPAAIADDVAVIAAALGGGDEAAGQAADHRISRFSAENCGWNRVRMTAVDHAFRGAPATVPAGVVAFEVTNDGDEAHMVKIVRRNDGVTTPFVDLLALPEQRQDELLEAFEPEDFADPGAQAIAVADLRPGDYALVCELPVGTTNAFEADFTPGTPTHAARGMVHEFIVI